MPQPEHQQLNAFSDPNIERSAGDIYLAKNKYPGYTWHDVRIGSADVGDPGGLAGIVSLSCWYTFGKYSMRRFFCCFDTRLLPAEATIREAKLIIKLGSVDYGSFFDGAVGVSTCDPFSPAIMSKADWPRVGDLCLVEPVRPQDMTPWDYVEFNFLPSLLMYIVKGGITKLCLREAVYDIANHEPLWNPNFSFAIGLNPADQTPVDVRPRLWVKYRL